MKRSERNYQELLDKAEHLTALVRGMAQGGPNGHDIDKAVQGLEIAKHLADALDFEDEEPEQEELRPVKSGKLCAATSARKKSGCHYDEHV